MSEFPCISVIGLQSFIMSHFYDVILMELSHSKDFQIIGCSLKDNARMSQACWQIVAEGKQELGPPGSLVWTASWLGNMLLAKYLRWAAWGILGPLASWCTISVPDWLLWSYSFHGLSDTSLPSVSSIQINTFDFLLQVNQFLLLNFPCCGNYAGAFHSPLTSFISFF